jgi:hypothetical protein
VAGIGGGHRLRRVWRGAAAWVLTLAVARVVVAQPERCGVVTPDRLDTAVEETIGWASRMQGDDGRWIYRYDADADADLEIYEHVRHAGLTMSLYQAAVAGHAGALATAGRGEAYLRQFLVDRDGWTAVAPAVDGVRYDIGATALFASALLMKRDVVASPDDDALLGRLGRFLVANTMPDGSVTAAWDPIAGGPVAGSSSPFFTGEALWALARLETAFPGEWRDPALRIARYIATARDDAEGRWPDVPDHWASYAFAEMARWPGPTALDPDMLRHARRIAELEALSIRYESQRTGSAFSRLTRGPVALPAGLGTLGEALGSLAHVPGLAGDPDVRRRARCVAGVLLDRQIDSAEAQRYPNPARVQGAWLRHGVTQIDDQQHAMSALLLVRDLEETDR